jgi:hypothetical protein
MGITIMPRMSRIDAMQWLGLSRGPTLAKRRYDIACATQSQDKVASTQLIRDCNVQRLSCGFF